MTLSGRGLIEVSQLQSRRRTRWLARARANFARTWYSVGETDLGLLRFV